MYGKIGMANLSGYSDKIVGTGPVAAEWTEPKQGGCFIEVIIMGKLILFRLNCFRFQVIGAENMLSENLCLSLSCGIFVPELRLAWSSNETFLNQRRKA
jgi:hypothetical protein